MNQTDHTAYPLSWPTGWPKTDPVKREKGQFKTSLEGALRKMRHEVELMGGKGLILSSNATLGVNNPSDPGVVAYFSWDNLPMAIPCDRWTRIEHNVQAIALTVEAMRGMRRWGAQHMIRAMFSGFKALPAPGATVESWSHVLGVSTSATYDQVKEAYRILAKRHHPDVGGDARLFRSVQAAWDTYEAQRRSA